MIPARRSEHPIYQLLPTEIEGFDALAELALDMHSSWDHATDRIWRELDPELWELTRNPWVVLQTVSRDRIENLLADAEFRQDVDELLQKRRDACNRPAWFQQLRHETDLDCIAYFCMEFMLSESLPIYSGGLGNVAGDQLKAASDLGVPVVGIGLLFQQGYFRQLIDAQGKQHALFPFNDPGQLPILPLREANGEWLRLKVALPGYSVWLRAWQVQVGRTRLYLLDSNDAANLPIHRGITSELYGGGPELRLMQELVLGIGGWRLLRELGLNPLVCHLNEGHTAFAVLERACDFMQQSGLSFDAALAVTRVGNVFTSHTAVEAGFDRFAPQLIQQYLETYAAEKLGIGIQELLALGRRDPSDTNERFNMSYLALRGSGAVNGVSRLHGQVSRHVFAPVFPNWPENEVPVQHVTNGIHVPTWDSAPADKLWTDACGKERWRETTDTMETDILSVPDERLWQIRIESTKALVEYARKRLARELAAAGSPPGDVEAAKHLFDPSRLTLGFARRFASYKRPNLLLQDPARLLKLLTDSERPVQLIIAGKAHPADETGKDLISQWMHFLGQSEARQHVIFLSDYDMLLTEQLVQGVDVWINTPRPPWEACGTSGMKVLVNGGLNVSSLDGWWDEAYTPDVGWAFGDRQTQAADPNLDAVEASDLYDVLEKQIIPEFYDRDEHGCPAKWLDRMRQSMAKLTPRFSAARTVQQYTQQYYLPAAKSYLERSAFNGALGTSIINWKHSLVQKWPSLRFGAVKVSESETEHHFQVEVDLNGLDSLCVHVELFAEGLQGEQPIRVPMKLVRKRVEDKGGKGASGMHLYQASVPSSRSASDYTPRILPHHAAVRVPLEVQEILWHH